MDTKTYVVKAGHKHGPSNNYGPGDTVEYTEREAAGFLDVLELATEEDAETVTEGDDLTQLSNVGPVMAQNFHDAGINTFTDFLLSNMEDLGGIPGVTEDKLAEWKKEAKAIWDSSKEG